MKSATRILSGLATLCILVGLSLSASAAPVVNGISGNVSQGQNITITGSSFSTNANGGPMLWDNFDGGSNGAVVANGSTGVTPLVHQGNLSSYSRWQRDGGGSISNQSILFNNSGPKAKSSLHARAAFTSSSYWGLNLYIPYTQFTTGKELYISFYYRMKKTGAAYPRQSKAWIAYESNWSDRSYFSTAYNNCESGGFRTHITETGPTEHHFSVEGADIEGEWVRFESYLKQSGPNIANGQWIQTIYEPTLGTPTRETYDTGSSQKLRTSSGDFVNWTFGGAYYSMCDSSNTGTIDVDDFYMDDTRARVELCDSSTWSARSKCELQLPTTWSDTSIIASVNQGYLDASKPAYLYVIDIGGNVNAQGYQITIGGTSEVTIPQTPANLSVGQ